MEQFSSASDNIDESELIQLLLKRQGELNSLLEVTQAINKNSSSGVLFEMIEVILKVHLKIGKMRLLINDEEHFYCAAKFGGDIEKPTQLQRICQVLSTENTIISLRTHPNKLLSQYDYFVPVVHKQDTLAFVLIGDFDTRDALINNDLNFVQTLINVIVVALENKRLFKERVHRERLQRDIELAGEVQNMLVGQSLPKTGSIEVGATYLPNQNIGGDYFDFFRLNDHEFLWCIADVSGKGVSAALLMANLQASLRAWGSVEGDLSKVIIKLNQIVLSNTNGDRFITLFLGKYNELTRELIYVNAGHNPPILLSNKKVKFLTDGTTILGVFEPLPFLNPGREILPPSSLVFSYTDGLVESSDEDIYIEDEELLSYVQKNCHLPVDDLNKQVLQKIQHTHKAKMNSDDVTLFTLRML